MNKIEGKKKRLPHNVEEALKDLKIVDKCKDETKFFALYFNYAFNNICKIAGIDSNSKLDPNNFIIEIKKKKHAVLETIASFLWLFKISNPKKDFPDYEERTHVILRKIIELRNFFTHPKDSINSLLVTKEVYVFLQGILLSHVREAAIKEGLRTDKLFKLKLITSHDKEKGNYEFTRKGLIFLCCMGLYRDEAMEFCSLFDDLKLPNKENIEVIKNVSTKRALRVMFTELSYPKRRQELVAENLDWMSFADIINYLNTVPMESHHSLSLTKENERLQKLSDISTESPENKETKYRLQKRHKNRFLSLTAAYIEDFKILPTVDLKRLDISSTVGRTQYCYGIKNDNRNSLDRHFITHNNSLHYSYTPKEHYGPIKIKSLHSSMGINELQCLLYLSLIPSNKISFNSALDTYYSTYHRILETLLNKEPDETENPWCFYFDDFEKDFMFLSGASSDELGNNLKKLMGPYFSDNILRVFTQDNKKTSREVLLDRLNKKIEYREAQTKKFIKSMEFIEKRNRDYLENKKLNKEPNLLDPLPKEHRHSDGDLIAEVFHLFNLLLPNEEKFRQLPLGEQHRGMKDYEYQILHENIGKLNFDENKLKKGYGFELFIQKVRPKLYDSKEFKELKQLLDQQIKEKKTWVKNNNIYGTATVNNPYPLLRVNATLRMLATAAAKVRLDFYNNIGIIDNFRDEELTMHCKRFGVRLGMPYDKTSLIKSILGIDLSTWQQAYDYEKKSKGNRSLADVEHIVSQIPFPNGFMEKLACSQKGHDLYKPYIVDKKFQLNRAIRSMPQHIKLRDFYDITPLVLWTKDNIQNSDININALQSDKKEIDKAIRRIKDINIQDLLLLKIALNYSERYTKTEVVSNVVLNTDKNTITDVYDYFDTGFIITIGEHKIKVNPNEINRPIFEQIKNYAIKIIDSLKTQNNDKMLEFRELLAEFQRVRALDRQKRMELIPRLIKMESRNSIYPENYVNKSKDQIRKMEYEFYSKKYKQLTKAEYDLLADIRNEIFHEGFFLDIEKAKVILSKLGF